MPCPHSLPSAEDAPNPASSVIPVCFRLTFYSIGPLVLVAGIYGFVKLQYYHHPFGYDYTDIFICGTDLFDNLWNEWLSTQLLSLAKGTLGTITR